ncbi:hypothetical protein Hanom_Chr12g01154161 [Helianthus anomalus]
MAIEQEPSKEVCSFDNADIAALRASGAFPAGAIICLFDREVRSDFYSDDWVCFFAYPFLIGLQYPFSAFITHFFELTTRHVPDLCIEDLPIAYRLRSHGSSRFLLFSTSKDPLFLKATKNEDNWKRKFFFVKRDSIEKGVHLPGRWLTSANFKELAPPSAKSEGRIKEIYQLPESERTFSLLFTNSSQKSSSDMSAPAKTPEVFDHDELDSYSGPMQVKQEVNPKSVVTSKPTSSKTAIVPKPFTASKPRGSSSRKRKEPDSPAASDVFPFENHGFSDSSKFMVGFLNQIGILGLEQLVFLYEDSCGLNKMLETKLKKAETTIADQAVIVTAKSEHYEAKFKAMTQEHQAAIKKITHEAQAKSDAA